MGIWWLSFCDIKKPKGQQFLGVALIEADDLEGAIKRAWREGCNPGGQISGYDLPLARLSNAKRVILARAPHHQLLDLQALVDARLVDPEEEEPGPA